MSNLFSPKKTELETMQQEALDLSTKEAAPSSDEEGLKTRNGIVLRPQPSDDPTDPLSQFRKHMAVFTISYLAFAGYQAVTSLVPATGGELGRDFGIANSITVYLGNAPVSVYGVGPFFWAPLTHFVGRRPVLLAANAIALGASIGVSLSPNYGVCMAMRLLQAFGGCAFWGLGPASIGDIFFRHEKGKQIGISAIAVVVAPFAGGIIGGGIIYNQSLGWRWTQWIASIAIGVGLILQFFFLPETVYIRDGRAIEESKPHSTLGRLSRRMGFRLPKRGDGPRHSFFFVASRPFKMFAYPSVLLASFWFGVAYMPHVGITALIPLEFKPAPFNFTTLDVGLSAFSGLVGALIGEIFAGPVIDQIAKNCERKGQEWYPERRLKAIWLGFATAIIGLLLFGITIDPRYSKGGWAPPLVGQGIYIFGIEILTTVIQTYILECYPQQGPEATLAFNFFRNLLSFTTPFFIFDLIDRITAAWAFAMFALLIFVLFWPTVAVLMYRGKELRAKVGQPNWGRAV